MKKAKKVKLADKVEAFIERGHPAALPELLARCLAESGVSGLAAVQRLAEDMYGGMTFNFEVKAPAAYCLVAWGVMGLDALVESAKRTPSTKNISLALETLAGLAAGEKSAPRGWIFLPEQLRALVTERVEDWNELFHAARTRLHDLVLWFQDDDDAASAVSSSIQSCSRFGEGIAASKQLFVALSARWVAISTPTLAQYAALLKKHPRNEPKFQGFYERFPQMLDPMALEVWARPDLHGFKEPDFVIRRTDNSYVIVEIESPAKSLVTTGGQVSAQVTQAVGQVAQYRSFLLDNLDKARNHFPGFRDPDGLVIIGMESTLTAAQARTLQLENEDRKGIRVVGFDWIAHRAEAITRNVIETGIGVKSIRMV